MRIPVSLLNRFWVRKAFVFWKEFEGASFTDSAWVSESLRSFEAEAPQASGVASEPQAVLSSPLSGANGADRTEVAPRRSSRKGSSVDATRSSGVIEPSGILPEATLVEGEVLAGLAPPAPPVRLVGRGATDRSSATNNLDAEQEKLPADLPSLALQGTS